MLLVRTEVPWTNEKVTPNDIFSFSWLDDDTIIEVINKNLSIDIRTEEWLDALNYVFFKAVDAYTQTLWRNKEYKINIDDFEEFESINDVLEFARETEEDTTKARINCAIGKICRAIDDTLNTPTIQMLDTKMDTIISNLKHPLSLEQVWEDYVWYIWWGKKRIDFVLSARAKSILSCIRKGMWSAEYERMSEIKDGVGFTFKTKTWEEALSLMSYIDSLYSQDNLETKGKWEELLNIIKNQNINLSETFFEKLENIDMTTKSWTAKWYIDIKLVWYIWWIPVEYKFSILSSENEDGVNFQPIYKWIKWSIEWEIIRTLNSYATEKDIKEAVLNLVENISAEIQQSPIKRWASVEEYYRELWLDLKEIGFINRKTKWDNIPTLNWRKKELKEWLRKYYISKLQKKKLKNWKIVYVNERAEELSKAGIYPEFFELKR